MITQRLTLVLGAGASHPYKFPLGEQLVWRIVDGTVDAHLERMGHPRYLIDGLQRELMFSQQGSIDVFPENRRGFLQIGKYAIALVLMPIEQMRYSTGDWHSYLWSQIGSSPDDFAGSKLSVVTFNYDGSLEYFLWSTLMSSFKYRDNQAAEPLRHIPIVHVYGRLDAPHFFDRTGRMYEPSLDPLDVRKAADRLYVIGEERNITSAFAEASGKTRGAEIVYFLGFGFHPENVSRLHVSAKADEAEVFLSCACGMRDDEKARARLLFPPQIGKHITFGRRDQDALEFVGSYPIFR